MDHFYPSVTNVKVIDLSSGLAPVCAEKSPVAMCPSEVRNIYGVLGYSIPGICKPHDLQVIRPTPVNELVCQLSPPASNDLTHITIISRWIQIHSLTPK